MHLLSCIPIFLDYFAVCCFLYLPPTPFHPAPPPPPPPPPPQVVFPRRAGKPKAGDAAAEELATAAQLKGKLMPVSTPAPALEKVAITADMKVRALGQAAALSKSGGS